MDLKEFCNSLSKRDQIKTGIQLARLALPVWQNYAEDDIDYTDSVVGMHHSIRHDLLKRAILELEDVSYTTAFQERGDITDLLKSIYDEFSDLVISLQDDDLRFPQPVATIFYAVYNLVGTIIPGEFDSSDNPRIYVSFNQSIETIVSEGILTMDEVAEKIGWR